MLDTTQTHTYKVRSFRWKVFIENFLAKPAQNRLEQMVSIQWLAAETRALER